MTLRRREEHGNTFALEIEYSLGYDGIPLNGEEIIVDTGIKNPQPTGFNRAFGVIFLVADRTNDTKQLPISDKILAERINILNLMQQLKQMQYGTILFA